MPGAEYQISCTSCELRADAFEYPLSTFPGTDAPDWPATLGEFFGERGGHECKYCPACGYVGAQRHFYKLVCNDCGRRERRFASMHTPPDQCSCGGERRVQLTYGRTPRCPDHPNIELHKMSLIELADINDAVTTIPCRACRQGTLVVGGALVLMD